jgi:hypothetical protein
MAISSACCSCGGFLANFWNSWYRGKGYGSDVKASHPLSTPLGMSAYEGEDEFRLSAIKGRSAQKIK